MTHRWCEAGAEDAECPNYGLRFVLGLWVCDEHAELMESVLDLEEVR